jgi:predicted Zn-dependent peptidase
MNRHFVREIDLEVRITNLSNGLTVVTERMPHIKTATLGMWVGAGSRNERSG